MQLPVHTVSAAALISRGDEVLLIKNPRRGWEFPGGMVDQGESVIAGLLREIHEETGLEVKVIAFVGAYSNKTIKQGYGPLEGKTLPPSLNLTFLCEYVSGEVVISEESLEAKWVSREEARKMVTYPAFIPRIDDMLNYDGSVKFSAFRNGDEAATENIRL